MVSQPMAPGHPSMNRRIEKSYLRGVTFVDSSRLGKLRQAPVRSVAVEAASRTCRRLGWTLNVRAKTFWGARMRLLIPEAVSEQLLRCRLFEPSVTAYMLRLLRPGDVFIDVGAHFGYFTLLGAWLTRDLGQVHSFEPTPSTFQMLVENTRSHRTTRLNQLAVWSQCMTLTINDFGPSLSAFNSAYNPRFRNPNTNAAQSGAVQVKAVTLDHYCDEHDLLPRFVKIDAESAESEIIRGMNDLLTKSRPMVSIEVGDFDLKGVCLSVELLQSVMDYGYLPFCLDSAAIRLHQLRESYDYDNILLVPEEQVKAISCS
jgi:FkbM family methyltransferase